MAQYVDSLGILAGPLLHGVVETLNQTIFKGARYCQSTRSPVVLEPTFSTSVLDVRHEMLLH
jgi:hypothetical protein